MNIHSITVVRGLQGILVSILLLFGSVGYADSGKQAGAAWSYAGNQGPTFWGKLDTAYRSCAVGKYQSPINVQHAVATQENILTFHYQPAALNVMSDGASELDIQGQKTVINDGHTLQVNFPHPTPAEFITVKGEKYRLLQFHFHTPSENLLDDQAFPLEIHFVNQSEKGRLVVVGVFIKPGKFNPTVEKLLKHLPPTKGRPYAIKGATISLSALLPNNKAYYVFPGSLTTPPCSEGVQWFVMANPVEASSEQIVELKKALPAHNARPVQPLNKRDVLLYSQVN